MNVVPLLLNLIWVCNMNEPKCNYANAGNDIEIILLVTLLVLAKPNTSLRMLFDVVCTTEIVITKFFK